MSDSLKVLNHFIRNFDKTLRILANRKNDSLNTPIEFSKIKLQNELRKRATRPDLSGSSIDAFKPENVTKQLENIQLILFCLRKYTDYLISSKGSNGPKDIIKNFELIQSSIANKSKEFISENLDKNLKNLTQQFSLPLSRLEKDSNAIQDEIRKDEMRRDEFRRGETKEIKIEKIQSEEIKMNKIDLNELKRDQPLLDHQSSQIDSQPKVKSKKIQNFKLTGQKLSERAKATRVPASRLGRIVSYGELAAGLGIGTFVELSKRQFGLADDSKTSPFFTDANANRIVKTLCKVRGAALKIGQILSIQDMISPELAKIFERVRQSADYMPEYQLKKVLKRELGPEWRSNFKEFDMKPFAAASIGQVHRAVLNDDREVALKIQYPGVAEGIDSDIKNLLTVLKVWDILPPGLFIDQVIKVTRKELGWELDYEREIAMCKRYNEYIEKYLKDENFKVPQVIDNLSTKKIITCEMVHGVPTDKLNTLDLDQDTINDVARRMLKLLLYEIFVFKFMQTDPNWSNFFYNPITNQISLIDFGAARDYSSEFIAKYYKILKAASVKNRDEILKHSIEIGFLTGHEAKQMIDAHVDSVLILGKVFEHDAIYDFGGQDISKRIHKTVPVMLDNRILAPPEEIYSLHRKLSGVFMLMVKLKAQVNCRELFNSVADYYERTEGLK